MPTAKPRAQRVDTRDWITRQQVADALRVSVSTVKNWTTSGHLHAERALRGAREVYVYDPGKLHQAPRVVRQARPASSVVLPQSGEEAALAFELFDAGSSDRVVVVKLRALPARVVALREEWLNAGAGDMVISAPAKAALEAAVGAFDGVADLVARVADLARRCPTVPADDDARPHRDAVETATLRGGPA